MSAKSSTSEPKISGRGKRKEKTKETKGNGFNAKGTQNKTKPPPIPRAEPTNNEGGKRHKKEILGGKDPTNEEGPAKGVKQGSGYPINTSPTPNERKRHREGPPSKNNIEQQIRAVTDSLESSAAGQTSTWSSDPLLSSCSPNQHKIRRPTSNNNQQTTTLPTWQARSFTKPSWLAHRLAKWLCFTDQTS